MKSALPIVFTCDDNYFKYTCVVIRSLLSNCSPDTDFAIHIISEFISQENQELADEMLKKHANFSIKYHFITIENKEQYHLNSYMSISTYYRFFIFDLLKTEKRVLYLDSDLIVENDIAYLADLDFEGKAAACSPSVYVQSLLKAQTRHAFNYKYFSEVLQMGDAEQYFNAGVILFNLEKIRNEGIAKKFLTALETIHQPVFQDQDILNAVLHQNGGVILLPTALNYTPSLRITLKRLMLNAIRHRLTNTLRNKWFTIYHYVGNKKPWQAYGQDSSLFYYYAFKTPFVKAILRANPLSFYKKTKLWLVSRI